MTRKKRQEASQRMKQIWAKRRAKAASKAIESIELALAQEVAPSKDELDTLREIVRLMAVLSAAGKQYLVNRFM